jgi:hypothetical protein
VFLVCRTVLMHAPVRTRSFPGGRLGQKAMNDISLYTNIADILGRYI